MSARNAALIVGVFAVSFAAVSRAQPEAKPAQESKPITVFLKVISVPDKTLHSPKIIVNPGQWATIEVSDEDRGSSFKAEVLAKSVDATHIALTTRCFLGFKPSALKMDVETKDLSGTSHHSQMAMEPVQVKFTSQIIVEEGEPALLREMDSGASAKPDYLAEATKKAVLERYMFLASVKR